MGTGWNHNGQRCGHCARDPLRQARCTCSGPPPAAATAAPSIDGAVEAVVNPASRSDADLEFYAVLVAADLTEAGWPTNPSNTYGRIETTLPGGRIAETLRFVPGEYGALTSVFTPATAEAGPSYRYVATYRADAERLARTFGSLDDPTPIGSAPPGVPTEVWQAASPEEPMRIETAADGTETLLWEVEGNSGYNPNSEARVSIGWLHANAFTAPRSSVIAVANRSLLRLGVQIPGDSTIRATPDGDVEFVSSTESYRLVRGANDTNLEGES